MTDSTTPAEIDPGAFWRTLGQRVTGMTVVTAAGADGPVGFLGLSAAHVTAKPPTMLVSIDSKTSALAGVVESSHFAINFLDAGAGAVADAFGGKGGLHGADRFAEGAWTTLVTGAPVYKNALGVFDCEVEKIVEHGETSIVIGKVVAVDTGDGEPLAFFRGKVLAGLG